MNENQKSLFDKQGYILIKNLFANEELDNLTNISKNILDKASKGLWNFIRVYREYPLFFGKINIFGVDYPLNEKLNSQTFFAIQKLNYKDKLLDILNWKNYDTSLIRLHTNSKFFNYQGAWHRDDSKFPSPDSIQVMIYLMDENGFRIVPKNKNHLLSNYGFPIDKQVGPEKGFTSLPKNMYDIISAKKGDMLIHESGLLHQGFVNKKECIII